MKTKKLFLAIVATLSVLPLSASSTWYVRSATGSDVSGDGTISNPWKTFVYAYSKSSVVSGDIIDLSGTFTTDYGIAITKSVTIQGTDNSTTIFDGTSGNASQKSFANMSTNNISLTIENVTFQNFSNYISNTTSQGGVITIKATGGGCLATLRNVIFKNNTSTDGGAINLLYSNSLSVEDCYFYNNFGKSTTSGTIRDGRGGALYIAPATSASTVTINRCLFESNTAQGSNGSAIAYYSIATSPTIATLTITNSTFSGNSLIYSTAATPTIGDGVINCLSTGGTGVDVKMTNNTIAYNRSARTTSGGTPGLYVAEANDVTLINNIFFSNFDSQTIPVSTSIYNYSSNLLKESRNNVTDVASASYNWITKTTNGATMSSGNVSGVVNGSSVGQLGLSGVLTNNGGKTKTLALNGSSTAINTGYYTTGVPATDQRNIQRSTTDIGAYEYVTYRSKGTGSWSSSSSWQLSGDNTSWSDVTVIPTEKVAGSIIIQNGHEITVADNATSPSLTINSGGQLTLNSGYTLGVTGNLNINSDNTNGTGTFVDKTTSGGLTISGTTTVQQFLSSARNWYIGSPVSGASSLPTVNAGTLAFYSYPENDANQATGANGYASGAVWNTVSSGTMAVGTGYIIKPSNDASTITFTGTGLNTSDKTISGLTYSSTNPKHGFNLICNPYPSYLNVLSSITANGNLEATVWYKTRDNATTPVYYNETVNATSGVGTNASGTGRVTGYIPPMQAFWVRTTATAIDNPQSITLSNASRSHTKTDVLMSGYPNIPTTVLKAPSSKHSNYTLLGLNVSNGTTGDETIVMFVPEASNGLDAYDSGKMNNNNAAIPEIYTTVSGQQLAINGMNSIPYDTEIPLGFTTRHTGSNFSIKASQLSNFDAGTKVILKDYLDINNPVSTDLTDGNSYSFTSGITSNNSSRFTLIFHAASVTTDMNTAESSNVWISTNANNEILVNGNVTGETSLTVYNAVGQKILSKNLTKANVQLGTSFDPGIYMITVTDNGKKITKKIIID